MMDTVQINDRKDTTHLVVRGEWIHFTTLINALSEDTRKALIKTIEGRMDIHSAIASVVPSHKESSLLELDHLAALHTALKNA